MPSLASVVRETVGLQNDSMGYYLDILSYSHLFSRTVTSIIPFRSRSRTESLEIKLLSGLMRMISCVLSKMHTEFTILEDMG